MSQNREKFQIIDLSLVTEKEALTLIDGLMVKYKIEQRMKDEEDKKIALAKLTEREKELLGLK